MSVINLDLSEKTVIGSFSGNFISANTAPYTVRRIGDVVFLYMSMNINVSGTAADQLFITPALTAEYRPKSNLFIPVFVLVAGTRQDGLLSINTAGALSLSTSATQAVFPINGGGNGYNPINVQYLISKV